MNYFNLSRNGCEGATVIRIDLIATRPTVNGDKMQNTLMGCCRHEQHKKENNKSPFEEKILIKKSGKI